MIITHPRVITPAACALERALSLVGVHALAKACGCTYQAVYKWRRAGVPASRAAGIESATSGEVRAEEVCPDSTFLRDAAGRVTGYTVLIDAQDRAA